MVSDNATAKGADPRYVVTDLEGDPHHLYDKRYRGCGVSLNWIIYPA